MGILFRLALAWRVGRINDLRRSLAATPPQFVSRRLELEGEIAHHRFELSRLLADGTVWPRAARRIG